MIKKKWRPNKTREILECILNTQDICFAVDVETSGLDSTSDTIIEIGIVKLQVQDGAFHPIDNLHLFIQPETELSAKITKITGITNEFLADKPTEVEIFPIIRNFLGDNPVFIAYNSNFDVGMVTSMYNRNNVEFKPLLELDVLAMARDVISGKNTKNGRFNLKTIAEAVNINDKDVHFHSAIDDIMVTVEILNVLKDYYNGISKWSCGEEVPDILSVWHWDSPYNHNQNATYVRTSCGTFLINDMSHFCQDKDLGTIDSIDMEQTLMKVAKRVGLENTPYDTLCMNLPKKLKK